MEKASAQQVIAVTGPMAAGKNYICSQMQKEGWAAIDADLLVHDAIELVKDKILKTFNISPKISSLLLFNKATFIK